MIKNYYSLSISALFTTLLLSPLTMAEQASRSALDVKCFVDLYGGGQSIYFEHINAADYVHLPVRLVNESVYTWSRESKKKVYAVNECVLEKNKFKSKIANNLDEKMTK